MFQVGYSGAVRAMLEQLAARARQRGQSAEFVAAVQVIAERLRSDPFIFGEPLPFCEYEAAGPDRLGPSTCSCLRSA